MIGLLLIAGGAVFLWAAFTGRATNVLSALKMDLPAVGAGNAIVNPGGSGGSGGTGSSGSGSSSDSGSHSALSDGGLSYVINKAYADMTQAEKHDANNFANQVGNLGSTSG
jgi:hypothetical protein